MKLIFLITFLFLLLYLYAICPRLTKRKQMHPYLHTAWAHRGLHSSVEHIPENSLPAFKAAIAEGYGIELDVHRSKDGKLVVFHDDTLIRMCNQEGRIEAYTWVQLSAFTLQDTTEQIPLFSQVLSLVNGQVPLLIEIKLPDKNCAICEALWEELKDYSGPYLIQSFNSLALRWFRKHHPDVLLGQLSNNLLLSNPEQNMILRFFVTHLLSNFYCRPDFISYKYKDRHNLGLWLNQHLFGAPVAMWTLRTPEAIRHSKDLVDMYIFENIEKKKKRNVKIL